MKPLSIALWLSGIFGSLLLVWTLASLYIVWGIEEARYAVAAVKSGYEIRRYEPMIVAETAIDEKATGAQGDAFRILAGYIFGGNQGGQNIEMTAPVVIDGGTASREIAMTAPVLVEESQGVARMAFVMPAQFTRESLPKPLDARVTFRDVPGRLVAAMTFSWYATKSRRDNKKKELLASLERDGLRLLGDPFYAGYNPPFSVPFLMRHEILVEIAGQ